MLIHFSQSSYFKANKGVDRYLLETYLLPGLETQGVIAGGSRGIELPVAENQEPEYLPLAEAKVLVLDWLEQNHNLLKTDKKKLERVRGYEQFAEIASNIYQSKIKDPNKLLTATRLQNLADLRVKNLASATTATAHYDPGKAIDDYNRLYLKLLSYSRVGVPHQLLQQIAGHGIPAGSGDLSETTLASVISAHLSRLYAAGSVASSPEAQDFAVAHELGNIIKTSYPEMTGLLNVLGDPQTASGLRKVTTQLTENFKPDSTLENYEKIQVAAAISADNLLLNQSELTTQIYNSFPSMGNEDRLRLTSALLKEISASASRSLTANEIVGRVGQKLNISVDQLSLIQNSLASSGVAVSLEYRQNELSLMVGTHYLTIGERNLLNKGINPFLAHYSPEKLTVLESKFLAEYNASPGHTKQFSTLKDAYLNEQQSGNPNPTFLERSRFHFAQLSSYQDISTKDGLLSLSDRALIRRTNFGRWVTDTRSRLYETQAKFFDKWIDIEETITGKKALNKLFDRWDTFAEGFTIPGTKIPLFRIVPWFYDQVDLWKKATTLNIVARTSSSTSWIGKSIHWTAKQYELGEFTVSGATYHFASAQWGRLANWSLARTGMSGVVKYAGVSASRTATRLLLKIGGRAIARLGEKAIGAILTAATAIGTAIFAIGMVFDLVSMGWEFLKNFIRNADFRNTILGWGAAIGTFFTALNFGSLFIAVGVMFALAFQTLLVSLAILGIVLVAVPIIQNNQYSPMHLDSSPGQIIANIVCTLTGSAAPSSSSNPRLAAGKCVYQLLTQFKINPLNKGNAAGAAFSSFSTSLGNGAAADAAQFSAQQYLAFQCVGLDTVVSLMTGGSGAFYANAKDMLANPPPGYRPVFGVGSCAPGDFFVDTGGAWGHTGLFVAPAGANIVCIDANSDGYGTVRDETTCRWPSNRIAGCLKKN